MKVERIVIKPFCSTCPEAISFKIDRTLQQDIIPFLAQQGLIEQPHFTKCNILYVESKNLIATGVFGQNTIQTRCKLPSPKAEDCRKFVNEFEELLTKI